MDKEDYDKFRDLLVSLELWGDAKRRRTLVKAALWGHRVLKHVELDGAGAEVAAELVDRCMEFDEPMPDGHPSLCALLAEIRRQGLADGCRKAVVDALAERLGCETAIIDWPFDPYPGMLALDRHQAPIFFGRRTETLELLDRLDSEQGRRLLLVAGASGSGKSSLVRAGLWATLADADHTRIRGSADWVISAMLPSEPAHDPFQAMSLSLLAGVQPPIPGLDRTSVEGARLRDDPDAGFAELLGRVLAGRPGHAEWLLIVDQFEELFTAVAPDLSERFLDGLLLKAIANPRFRVVATVRSDFLDRCIAHPGLRGELNAGAPIGVGAPGPAALAHMIEGPLRELRLKQPVTLDDALVNRLVADASTGPGGLALLAFALKDLYDRCRDKGYMGLADYRAEDFGGLDGVIAKRADAAIERSGVDAVTVLPGVFSRLLTVQADGTATRRREALSHWQGDTDALALIGALADRDSRLLVTSEKAGAGEQKDADADPFSAGSGGMVEVAHEALFTAWPQLGSWIDRCREALIRRPQVERDAERWEKEGRPDHRIYKPDIVIETRDLLEAAALWKDMAQDARVAHFLVREDAGELLALALRAKDSEPGTAQAPVIALLHTLCAEGRRAETIEAFGRLLRAREPDFADWLRAGLDEALILLAGEKAAAWFPRRLRLGDLMAILGDHRPGVGLCPDGLPEILWQSVPEGPFVWQEGEERTTGSYRIARYPITNAHYRAFTKAGDYDDPRWWRWWREGFVAPEPAETRWDQDNRPRVSVAWVEALAFCRWLTARFREQALIAADEVIRLPVEYEWEKAARGTDGRTFPWGEEYRSGDASIDETYDETGPLYFGETTAVGLYPRNVSPYGVVDCSGNVWEWCLNIYNDPDNSGTSGNAMRAVRGGAWFISQANARASARFRNGPDSRDGTVGFRPVCCVPIDR